MPASPASCKHRSIRSAGNRRWKAAGHRQAPPGPFGQRQEATTVPAAGSSRNLCPNCPRGSLLCNPAAARIRLVAGPGLLETPRPRPRHVLRHPGRYDRAPAYRCHAQPDCQRLEIPRPTPGRRKRGSTPPDPSPPPAAANAESSSEPAARPRATSRRRSTSPPARTVPPNDADHSRAVAPWHPFRPPPAPGNRHCPGVAGHAALPPADCSTHQLRAKPPEPPRRERPPRKTSAGDGRAGPGRGARQTGKAVRTRAPSSPAAPPGADSAAPACAVGHRTTSRPPSAHQDSAKNRPDAHRPTATAGAAGRTRPPRLQEEDRNDAPRAPKSLGPS